MVVQLARATGHERGPPGPAGGAGPHSQPLGDFAQEGPERFLADSQMKAPLSVVLEVPLGLLVCNSYPGVDPGNHGGHAVVVIALSLPTVNLGTRTSSAARSSHGWHRGGVGSVRGRQPELRDRRTAGQTEGSNVSCQPEL